MSGLVLGWAQPPYGISIFAVVAISLWMFYVRAATQENYALFRNAFILGWITYSVFVCMWIQYFGAAALVGFTLCNALYAWGFFRITTYVSRRYSSPLVLGLCWVAFEWIMAHMPVLSFSWLTLATTNIDVDFVRRFARVGGGALIAFLIVVLCDIIAQAFVHLARSEKLPIRISWKFATVGLMLLTVTALTFVRVHSDTSHVSISVVQANDKNRYLSQQEIDNDYLQEAHISLADTISSKRDVIVFPESSFMRDIEKDVGLKDELRRSAHKTQRLLIANSIGTSKNNDYNRNYFYSPDMKLLGTYDKKRLVPFGEYVPLKALIGDLSIFDPIGNGFTPGSKNTTVRGVTSLICFESAFTDDVKHALTSSSKLLVVTTNNRSYRRSGNSSQHLAQTRLRAAEYGISAIQASVSGHSAIIERDGSVVSETPLFTRGILSDTVSFGRADSLYAQIGDWLSLVALFVVGYLLIRIRATGRRFSWKKVTLRN